jgi:hypothetical protein
MTTKPKQKVSTKATVMSIIKEEIARAKKINEMARQPITVDDKGVVSGLGAKFIVPDEKSPTGHSTKGHGTFKDGTPAQPVKGPYVPKSGNVNIGRPTKSSGNGWMSKSDKAEMDAADAEIDGEDEGDESETPKSNIGTGSSVAKPSDKKLTPDERKKYIRDLVKQNKSKALSNKDLGGIAGTGQEDVEDELSRLSGRTDKFRGPDLDADDERNISDDDGTDQFA